MGLAASKSTRSIRKNVRVRLIRKLAEELDGVDLSGRRVGDVLKLTPREAALLVAEGWAVRAETPRRKFEAQLSFVRAEAADRGGRSVLTSERLRDIQRQIERGSLEGQTLRRAEDRIREELHDDRARVIVVQKPATRTP